MSLQNTLRKRTVVHPKPKKTVDEENREECWDVQRDHHKGLAKAPTPFGGAAATTTQPTTNGSAFPPMSMKAPTTFGGAAAATTTTTTKTTSRMAFTAFPPMSAKAPTPFGQKHDNAVNGFASSIKQKRRHRIVKAVRPPDASVPVPSPEAFRSKSLGLGLNGIEFASTGASNKSTAAFSFAPSGGAKSRDGFGSKTSGFGFSFGGLPMAENQASGDSSSDSSFGVKLATAASKSPASETPYRKDTFSFGAPGQFTFDAPKADDKAGIAPATGGFTFGAPKEDGKLTPVTGGPNAGDKAGFTPPTGRFTFGAPYPKLAPDTGKFSFGAPKVDDSKPDDASWKCDACVLRNKQDASKCAACDTVRPGHGEKQDAKETVDEKKTEDWDVQRNHYKGLADAAFSSCNYELAIQEYSNAITFDPECHILYFNRSAACLANGEKSNSLADAETCVSLKPDFVKGHNRLASSMMSLGKWNEAKNVYKHILSSLDADNDVAKKGLQDCREKEFRTKEAENETVRSVQQELEKESVGQSKKKTDTPSEQSAGGDKEEDGEDEDGLPNDFVDKVEEVKTVKMPSAEEEVDETSTDIKLALAAAALVEAVSLEVDSLTQNQISMNLNLEALKGSFETELRTLAKSVKASNEKFDDMINTMNQKITILCAATEKTNTLLEAQAKLQRLEVAIDRAEQVSFKYNCRDNAGRFCGGDTRNLATCILNWFILDNGYKLPAGYLSNDCTDASKALFREAIVKQITTLTGRQARLHQGEGDDNYSIFYE